ncbi:MAG: hypothetical protein WCW52_03205 [Elusimicrobiales bacterium]|jgi:hypothetical protein
MIKKILFGLAVVVFQAGAVRAGSGTYSGFPGAAASDLRPFARDLGGLLGSGTNQTARVLGFGGFDVSGRGSMQFEPEHKDGILKKNKPFGLGWVQAEIGMPYRIDGFIKAASFDNMAVAGGGLKYGLTQPQKKMQAMLVATGNLAAHKFFYAAHYSYGLVVSFNTPVVSPYFGLGMDNTRLTVQIVNDPSLSGRRVSVSAPRYMAGAKMTFLTYGYLSGGYTYTHGRGLVTAGLGLRI